MLLNRSPGRPDLPRVGVFSDLSGRHGTTITRGAGLGIEYQSTATSSHRQSIMVRLFVPVHVHNWLHGP